MSFPASTSRRVTIDQNVEGVPQSVLGRAPFQKTQIASAVQLVLEPRTHIVTAGETLEDVERILGVMGMSQSLLLGVKTLIGKTLQFNGSIVQIVETGTKIPVRMAANSGQYMLTA